MKTGQKLPGAASVTGFINDKLFAAVARMRLWRKGAGREWVVDGAGVQRDLHFGQISRIAVAGKLERFYALFSPAFGHGCIEVAAADALP